MPFILHEDVMVQTLRLLASERKFVNSIPSPVRMPWLGGGWGSNALQLLQLQVTLDKSVSQMRKCAS